MRQTLCIPNRKILLRYSRYFMIIPQVGQKKYLRNAVGTLEAILHRLREQIYTKNL